MADVTRSKPLQELAHFGVRAMVAVALLASLELLGAPGYTLSYLGIASEEEYPEGITSNQYTITFLGSSIGQAMRADGKEKGSLSRTLFTNELSRGSLQVEYTMRKRDNIHHSIGIYEDYEYSNRSLLLNPFSRSANAYILSVSNVIFDTGEMYPEDELTLTLSLARYTKEIADGIEKLIEDASLKDFGLNETVATRFSLASTAISTFSSVGNSMVTEGVVLTEEILRKTKYLVFYVISSNFSMPEDFGIRLKSAIDNELNRGTVIEINRSLIEDLDGYVGNVVFLVDRMEIVRDKEEACTRENENTSSEAKCKAVDTFVRAWLTDSPQNLDDGAKEIDWRDFSQREESGSVEVFFERFDLNRRYGGYEGKDATTWTAVGAMSKSGREGRCLFDVFLTFTLSEGQNPGVIRVDIAQGNILLRGRRPSYLGSQQTVLQCEED